MAGTTLVTRNSNLPANVYLGETDAQGFALSGKFDTISTPPAGASYANVFQKGCLLLKTDAADTLGALYQNTGTLAVPAWTLMPISASGSGITALTGDVTATGPGSAAATIANNAIIAAKIATAAVTTPKISDGNVTLAKLAAGITPSHVVKFAGKHTTTGGSATEAFTVTGVLSTDIVIATLQTVGGTARTIITSAPTTDTITLVFSGDPSTDHIVSYQVLRVAA